jgi:hypothetical protein
MKNMNKTQLGNYICAVTLVLVLITQFLPFWLCTDCKDHKDANKVVSIAEYTWFPDHHKPITKGMTNVYLDEYGQDLEDENGKKYKFAVDDIVTPLVIVFLGSIIGAVVCTVFSKYTAPALIPLLVGGIGVYWYLTCPAMKVGANWPIHVVVAGLAALAALGVLVYGVLESVKSEK